MANLFEEVIILKDKGVVLKANVNSLMEKSYFLSGSEDGINKVIKDKRVIHREEFGATKIVGIYDKLSEEEIKHIKENRIEISNIPLQKLFVFLTESFIKEESSNEFN